MMTPDRNEEMTMRVSAIVRDGKTKKAYVSFEDRGRTCEGTIPDCVISKNDGFSDEELHELEEYMRMDLAHLKEMAAGVHILDALKQEKKP